MLVFTAFAVACGSCFVFSLLHVVFSGLRIECGCVWFDCACVLIGCIAVVCLLVVYLVF